MAPGKYLFGRLWLWVHPYRKSAQVALPGARARGWGSGWQRVCTERVCDGVRS